MTSDPAFKKVCSVVFDEIVRQQIVDDMLDEPDCFGYDDDTIDLDGFDTYDLSTYMFLRDGEENQTAAARLFGF